MTSDGALNGVDVQIVGIVNSGAAERDARYLRITLPAAQRLLQSDRVTNLVVGLDYNGKHRSGLCGNDAAPERPARSSWC